MFFYLPLPSPLNPPPGAPAATFSPANCYVVRSAAPIKPGVNMIFNNAVRSAAGGSRYDALPPDDDNVNVGPEAFEVAGEIQARIE